MAEIAYLLASDVLGLTEWFVHRLGYPPPILRGNGQPQLESAVQRAQTTASSGGTDLIQHAAAVANGIALNHPFVDGNKRSAWIACVAFLWLNGRPLPDDALDPLAEQSSRCTSSPIARGPTRCSLTGCVPHSNHRRLRAGGGPTAATPANHYAASAAARIVSSTVISSST